MTFSKRSSSTKGGTLSKDKDKDKDKDKGKVGRKDSKQDEFDSLLKSGETIVMSLNPSNFKQMSIKEEKEDLGNIIEKMTGSKRFEDQKVDIMKPRSPTSASTSLSSEEALRNENKRLEQRIQQLNSDLFKERASNLDLSNHVKDLLSELESLRRRSINNGESGGITSMEEQLDTELIQTQSTQRRLSNLNAADRAHYKAGLYNESQQTLAPPQPMDPEPTPPKIEFPESKSSDDSKIDWQERYKQLEERSNLLSKKAVQIIQETKLQMVEIQQENLRYQDYIRDIEEDLQKRNEEKSRAMMLIPKLIEMVNKLQSELLQEKQRRDIESEFDALQLQASRV